MAHVFLTRIIPGKAPELLAAAGHEVETWTEPAPVPPDELCARLARADAVISMVNDAISRDLLAACPRLRVVANMAVGHDNIDREAAAVLGIWATNTPGVLAETTADHAFALLLAAARYVALSDRDTRAGGWTSWSPTAFLGVDIHGATLGIVGLGEIGEAMARRARGFWMRVLYTSRTRRPAAEAALGVEWTALADLLAASDFVSMHAPLTPETVRSFDRTRFAAMKPGAIFVNTSRGGVVDQDALVEALASGHLGGAALDVTDPEPLPTSHPPYSFPNVVITPHIASATVATRSRMAAMAAANVIAVLDGQEPPNPVNRPEALRPLQT